MTNDPDQLLSEFIDAWNAGRRPDAGSYLERAGPDDRAELGDSIAAFLTWAPTPRYDAAALEAIAAEPIVREALGAAREPAGLWPSLLSRARRRAEVTNGELAASLARVLGLPPESEPKAAGYLAEMEAGSLDPAGVSRRLLDALARLLGLTADELEGAGELGSWGVRPAPAAAPMFRAEASSAEALHEDLEVLADALAAPPAEPWDEVDELFRGGR